MRHARRVFSVLAGFTTGFIASAAVAYAAAVPDPHEKPGFYNQYPDVSSPAISTSAAGLSPWQFAGFVALVVLLAVAIVGLGYSLSSSRRPEPSHRSQAPLRG